MKGFTLIELLIVIAILAVLTTTVVLVLNPAQMLAEARDSQRMSDLDSVKSAISIYLATATSTPTLTAGPFAQGTTATCLSLSGTCTARDNYTVSGSGWVGVDLTAASAGSPLSTLPRDPSNNATYHYAYAGNDTYKTFELNAVLESVRYSPKMATDGGPTDTVYEIGTDPGLDL
jgi:prepilin-type N-terminal cleavage/methylation domain-containing protein